ncbi:DUF1127 domain-containing protein [Maritalea myrionectae]
MCLRHELGRKSDRQLEDIGLRRDQIVRISKKWIRPMSEK